MGKDKKNLYEVADEDHDAEILLATEENDPIQRQAEQVTREAETMRVEILVAVNSHSVNDKVTVERDHPFYSGLVTQNMARVID